MESTPPHKQEPDPEFNALLEKAQRAADARDGKTVQELAMAMLLRAAESAMQNPSPTQELHERADSYEEKGEWSEAESVRKETLALALKESQPGFATKAHWELAIHFTARGLFDLAVAHSGASVESARKSEIPTLVHVSLARLAKSLLARREPDAALAAVDEALTLLPNEFLTANSRAAALILRAHCVTLLDNLPEAEGNLREAGDILTPKDPNAFRLGMQRTMTLWWHGSSILCSRKNDWSGALKAAEQELPCREEAVSNLGSTHAHLAHAEALAWLEVCARANGLSKKAAEAREQSDQIRANLKLPPLELQ